MYLKSIRWRLPLSYAGIALLAALALGSVMLLVLNSYYSRQERDYLLGNAQALQPLVESALRADVPPESLQEMARNLSFLSQTRIRVLDAHGNPLADSGVPDPNQMVSISNGMTSSIVLSEAANTSPGTVIGTAPQIPLITETGQVQGMPGAVTATSGGNTVLVLSASPYGYSFVPVPSSANGDHRSAQVISLPLAGSLGMLEISKGPAYGRDIIRSVGLAWAGAGVVAILLAALAGWVASRQVIHPVLALTDVTQRMESGDLSVRVNLPEKRPASEFQALANAFNSMAQRVEDTVSTLRAFVADAAHELHTPLTALHTNLELAADEADVARRSLFLERAQEQGSRLETLVSGLLDLSRIEAAQTRQVFLPVNLNGLLGDIGRQFAPRVEQSGNRFVMDIPDENVEFSGNESQVRQIVTNLLENALKFTPAGGTITLGLLQSADEAILTILDTGIGIPPEDLPHLFERFHRGRNASRYPGSGLGLAITKALVSAHGGSIRADSKPGEGTMITVRLPVS